MPSLPGYIYAHQDNTVFVNLFISSTANIQLKSGRLSIRQKSGFPWDGEVELSLSQKFSEAMTLAVRLPSWAIDKPLPGNLYSYMDMPSGNIIIKVNGKAFDYEEQNGYALIKRQWEESDTVRIILPMEIQKVRANNKVSDNKGRMAILRGPLVYCAEWVDNNSKARNLLVEPDVKLQLKEESNLLNGINTIQGKAYATRLDDNKKLIREEQQMKLIPYYAWAHRGNGEMMVWLPYEEEYARPCPPPGLASGNRKFNSKKTSQEACLNGNLIN